MCWRSVCEEPVGFYEDVRHRRSGVAGMCCSHFATPNGGQEIFLDYLAQVARQILGWLVGEEFQPLLYENFELQPMRRRRILPH